MDFGLLDDWVGGSLNGLARGLSFSLEDTNMIIILSIHDGEGLAQESWNLTRLTRLTRLTHLRYLTRLTRMSRNFYRRPQRDGEF